MGQKASKAQSKKPEKSTANQTDYAVYLLPNNEEKTLAEAHLLVAAQTESCNAVILFPDPNDVSSSSSGTRKYNACFICDGHWARADDIRKEVSIGNRNFSLAQLMAPNTIPNYKNIINAALAFGGIQLSQFERLPKVIHQNAIAPHQNLNSLAAAKNSSRTLYGFYKPEETKGVVKKLLKHAVYATAADIKEIKEILDRALSRKPPDLDYLRELLCTPGTVKSYNNHIYEKRTLYQIALGAREYNVMSESGIQVVDGLVEMLGEYFKKLPDGEMLQKQQYDAQFPKGFEETEKKRISNDSRELNRVIEVVDNASDVDCQQTMALDSFHGYDLRPSAWAATDNEVLASAIYLQAAEEGLTCRLRGLDGQVKNELISWDKLQKVPLSVDDIIKKKLLFLPTILEQLAESGQFYTAKQIQKLKVLSQATVCAHSQNDFDEAWKELEKLMKSIAGESINFDVLKALYQFRNYLEPKAAYTTGYHSNPQLLLEAYQSYDNNFARFGDSWFSPKNVLCVQKIAGLAQRDLSACELQLHAQGPYAVLVDGNKSKRTFSFTYGGGAVLPLDSDPCFRLGYNYFAGGERGRVAGREGAMAGGLGILMSSKNISAAKLMQRPGNQPKNIPAMR